MSIIIWELKHGIHKTFFEVKKHATPVVVKWCYYVSFLKLLFVPLFLYFIFFYPCSCLQMMIYRHENLISSVLIHAYKTVFAHISENILLRHFCTYIMRYATLSTSAK